MTEPRDEPLMLPHAQAMLLWCMRMWVLELARGIKAQAHIDDRLGELGAADASSWLGGFMFALSHGATRMIDVLCVCRSRISADEQALLDVLSLAQAGLPLEALLILRDFVTPAGAQAALQSAEGVATVLALAGHFLPSPLAGRRPLMTVGPNVFHPLNTSIH